MKKKLTALAIVAVLMAGSSYAEENDQTHQKAFQNMPLCEKHRAEFMAKHQQRQAKNKAFRESLKAMEPAERQAALQNRSKSRYEEEISRITAHYQEIMENAKSHMADNENLTEEQKKEKLASLEKRYQEAIERAKEHYNMDIKILNSAPEERKQLRKQQMERRKENIGERAKNRKAHGKDFCVMCAKEAREAKKNQ